MVTALVDTSVVIDLIRGFSDAHKWLSGLDEEIGLTDYVWLEVIQGAPNKKKQIAAIKLLSDFARIEVTPDDTRWAVQALVKVNLSHNVDALDSLIASPCHRLQIPLYTRNLKHFTPLLGDLAVSPY
jgi:predicted nucleic acid-binding protein